MRKSKGKWVVSIKDTYSTDTIDSMMLGYIKKLYDTIKDKETIGVPMYYVNKQALVQGVEYYSADDTDLDAAHQLRLRDLEELIWTYSPNEPDIMTYNFTYGFLSSDGSTEYKSISGSCTNKEGRDQYMQDEEVYWKRKLAGYELCGKLWRELQW